MKKKIALLTIALACLSCLPARGQVQTDAGSAKKENEATAADAQTAKMPLKLTVADSRLVFEATGAWKSVKPKSRMLAHEIQIPKVEGDDANGRLTIMGAGGSIDANIKRWEGQFTQPDGAATQAKTKELTIDEMKVTIVDVSGTFTQTMGGPFAGGKKVESADQRMLAAIVQTPQSGNYFIKLVGPEATVKANEAEFKKMIMGAKLNKTK